MRMTRREFLGSVGIGTAAVLLGCGKTPGGAAGGQTRTGPNILLIMSDEHNASVLGCYGNKVVRTPNLDALAGRGIAFDSFYCNSPLCVPSRLAFTAGKYISRTGAWSNSCQLAGDSYPSIARVLNSAGYRSYLCGKMHYGPRHRYGFTETGGNMNSEPKDGLVGRRAADDLTPSAGVSERFAEFRAGEESKTLTHDRRVTAGVVDFLSGRRAKEGPFFLVAGYLAPHFPLVVSENYWKHYEGKVPMPEIPPGHLESQVLNYQHLRIGFNVEDAPEETIRRGRELYYGLTEWLDDEVGKVLKALEANGLADDTVVIYTSDHGENMGEHGLWWKNSMYEHAVRVPLLVSYPKRWKGGQRRGGACSMVDLVQTIAEIAGGKTPADWDGDSMAAWMDDPAVRWKDMAVSEYYAHNIASGFAMIRMGTWKYVYHTRADAKHGPQRELYDLASDPGEFKNLAAEPAQAERIQTMHAALVAEIGEEPDETEKRCREQGKKGYGRR